MQIRHMDNSYISNGIHTFAQETGDKLGISTRTQCAGAAAQMPEKSASREGGPGTGVSIPSRYVHSHYNFCAEEDVDATVRMAVEVIRGLDEEDCRDSAEEVI